MKSSLNSADRRELARAASSRERQKEKKKMIQLSIMIALLGSLLLGSPAQPSNALTSLDNGATAQATHAQTDSKTDKDGPQALGGGDNGWPAF